MSDIKVAEIKTDTIKNQAGTTSLNIASTGVVIMPNRPAFNVQINLDGATNSSNVFANTRDVYLNQGNHWQASGANEGKFVVPIAGLYFFQCEGFASDASNQNAATLQYKMHFTKNGNTLSDRVGRFFYGYNRYQDHQPVIFSELLSLAVDDAIGVRVEQGYMYSSTALKQQSPRFFGYLVG
tara:strand:+ start:28 stop:573 length:546 start_codon:yes stop_codon:yes gene_type:complete